jgi:hypothetical protein
MSDLTSQQRKLVYLGGLLVLLVPIIFFGLPSAGKEGSGGALAQLRQKYDLGESNLGDVDPSSVTMNLVLLGLRGIAVNQLWIQMDTAKTNKDWPRMLEATQSIVKLQPHYEKVWDFNGWNLAWNTSVEWDAVPDRYYWVKEGGKFMMQGIGRNEKSTELRYDLAKIFQQKLGVADESAYFRKYFLSDPDREKWKGGPDTEFHRGPEGEYPEPKDSYLVAHDWYKAAVKNEVERNVPLLKGTLDRTAFHALPARCLFEYASALHKDGQFGEVAREAWANALDEWINKFGREDLFSPYGTDGKVVHFMLEATDEDIRALASTPEEEARVRAAIDSFQKIVNYRYWRTRGMSEAEPETAKAHQDFYEAGEKYKKQEWRAALKDVEEAMKGFENLISRYPDLRYEDNLIEECMLAILMWHNIYRLEILPPGEQPPQDFPLRSLWEEQQSRMPEIERLFRRRYLTQVSE